MAQNYETVLLLDPELSDEAVQNYIEQVTKLIEDAGGTILKAQLWGKRHLEYTIQKKTHAIYALWYFEMASSSGDLVVNLEHIVRVNDELLREMTIKAPGLFVCESPPDIPFIEAVRSRRPMGRPRRSGFHGGGGPGGPRRSYGSGPDRGGPAPQDRGAPQSNAEPEAASSSKPVGTEAPPVAEATTATAIESPPAPAAAEPATESEKE